MKMNKVFAYLTVAALTLPLTSCLKDQADVFDKPSSTRLEDYLENVRDILQDSEHGWALSYYPGAAYPTCYFGVQFGAQQVTAYGQGAPENGVTSSYKLDTDDGAVLSFDTYNSVLHYYATADQSHYQARGGDFEFTIMNVTDDRITLRGKRSRNLCYLDRLKEAAPAFLKAINQAEADFKIVAFSGEVSGGLVEGTLDNISHTLTIGRKDAETGETVSARYMIVPGGIHINEPFTFQGVEFQDFTYDDEAGTLTGSGIVFQKMTPEGYVSYQDYLGKWTLNYSNGSFEVELVEKEAYVSYSMKGVSDFFEPEITYNAARGYLSWVYQAIGQSGSLTIILAPWDGNSGYLTWTEGVGMDSKVVDNTVDELVLEWSDNGVWGNYKANGWLIWSLDSSGSNAGSFASWTFATGSYQLPGDITMTKIVE